MQPVLIQKKKKRKKVFGIDLPEKINILFSKQRMAPSISVERDDVNLKFQDTEEPAIPWQMELIVVVVFAKKTL